jgi:maleate cis-trans isomerase
MPETPPTPSTDLNRAVRDAKKQAGEVSDAAQDLYNQAVDSASHTAGSFERELRNTIEKQPYTAVVIALALGWLFGRMHRPL